MAKIKATTDGKKGGLLGGNKPHSKGGIKAVVVDAGNKPVELESSEAIIKKSALKDKTVKTLTGTNAEILNNINTEAGGNPIYAPSEVKMAKGGSITPSAISKMTKAEQKAFYKTKEGKELDKQTYTKWKSLVNMSKGELKEFYDSEEGKKAGLSASEAKAEGIDSGRESARWIMKMKDIPYTEWTSNMWRWAKKQISFISRMKGVKGDLYDDKGNKTRKHLALLIWGHNPKKMAEGGNVGDTYSKTLSAIGRFKPKETIFFNPPLVGVNGVKLISYTWAYEWTMLPNREGEMKDKRVSDWTKAESSAETGRDIVHQYTIEEQDGSLKTVSSESVPILLGYSNKSQSKTFGNLATASKTLAKQQIELSILEAKKNEFDDALKSIIENGFPNPKVVKGDGFRPYKLFIGDASCWINDDGTYDEERLKCAKDGYINNRLSEIGINYYSYSAIPSRIYDVKKRIEKQKRKINEILSADKMAEGGNVGNYYNNEQETMIEEPLMFEEGGVVPSDKTPEELAKDFVNSLPQDVIQEMKDKYNALIAEMVVNEKNALDAINNEITELEAKKEALSGDRSDDAFKKRSEYYTSIRQKQNGLRHQTNRYYAMKNGGSLATFTDKKGVEHKDIPDFTNIGSEDISFDEENILTQTPPQYIPIISEDSFRDKGYLFDAIRYSSDTYIIAVNGYRETLLKGFEYTTEHPSDAEQGYALVTLDQLILINDYYYTKAKATERKKAEETNKRTEERWDKMPREDRERYYASKYFYESMPVSVKKKVTKDAWDLLTLEQKEGFYKPIKIVQGKRLVSKLDDDKMWASFHNMYERFLNPEVKIRIEKGVRYGHPEVFEYWFAFRDMMKWKLKDIKFQRQFLSDIRKTALETSFGMSNTNDTLYDSLGILVKRQNGSNIKPLEIEQISVGWHNINKVYGGLVSLAKEEAMKISHTGTTLVFASKAAGVYIPSMKTIAVSAKYGDAMFESILAHEVAHWIDNKIGEQNRLRWATDNYESTAGMIASTFRKRMNVKSESDYINATKECFARALEQFFAISVFGENATVFPDPLHPDLSMTYFQSENYVNKAVYESTMKPLIEKFFQENKDFFKYGIETNVADANVSKEVAPITTPMEVKPEVVMTEEERLRKDFDDLAKADTMTDAQKATIQRIADNLADKLKGIELPAKTENTIEEKEDESMSKENLLASLEGAKVAVEFLEGQQKQDMIDYIEGLETLIEIL